MNTERHHLFSVSQGFDRFHREGNVLRVSERGGRMDENLERIEVRKREIQEVERDGEGRKKEKAREGWEK